MLLVFNPANSPCCVLPWLKKIPFAIHVDGLEWKRTKWPIIGRGYLYAACWFSTAIASRIIADNRGIQDFYRDKWRTESRTYASYGAYQVQSKQPHLLSEYDLVAEGYFLVVARMEPENNTALIVDAFKQVRTDKKLVIVGGTAYKSRYFDALVSGNKDDRVRFLGPIYDQDRLNELFCNSFAYIHGHMVGGTNPVLLQALGAGCCVVYLDQGYRFNREVVGDAGVAFAPSAASLACRLQELLENPDKAKTLGALARERVASEYNWDRVADQYENLCFELLKSRRSKFSVPRSHM